MDSERYEPTPLADTSKMCCLPAIIGPFTIRKVASFAIKRLPFLPKANVILVGISTVPLTSIFFSIRMVFTDLPVLLRMFLVVKGSVCSHTISCALLTATANVINNTSVFFKYAIAFLQYRFDFLICPKILKMVYLLLLAI